MTETSRRASPGPSPRDPTDLAGGRKGRGVGPPPGAPPGGRAQVLVAAGHTIELRGPRVLVDGVRRHVAPAPAALLRALASQPGRVFSRAELLELVWAGTVEDEHVAEVTVGRLRRALGPAAAAVRTVVKRGYRLAVEPPAP